MGLGAGAIPGGNDTLLLTGIPAVPRVECVGDVCYERPAG